MTGPAGSAAARAVDTVEVGAPRPLLAVAHGSRDPASSQLLEVLISNVVERLPDVPVRLAYIENATPLLSEVLPSSAGAVVVPLLLSRGTHVRRDLPPQSAPPLGPDPALTGALLDRLDDAGVAPGTPLVLAATGSATRAGQDDVRMQAALLAESWGGPVTAGFVTAAPPTVEQALEAAGPAAVVVSYFLAPGLLPDAARAATRPLGDHPALADLVVARYRQALARSRA